VIIREEGGNGQTEEGLQAKNTRDQMQSKVNCMCVCEEERERERESRRIKLINVTRRFHIVPISLHLQVFKSDEKILDICSNSNA
jgi:hypothetical protein